MIHSISCKNFYSFKDETSLSFVVSDKAPHTTGYFAAPSGTRLSKIISVVGPNAAGKTNLMKILPFVSWLVNDSFKQNIDTQLMVRPTMAPSCINMPTELEVVYEINGNIYRHGFAITQERIISEELRRTSFAKQRRSTKKLFARKWSKKNNLYEFEDLNFGLPKGADRKSLLRANTSVVSAAIRYSHAESMIIGEYWARMQSNVVESGWLGGDYRAHMIDVAKSFYYRNKELKNTASQLLSRFDLGLSSFDIRMHTNPGKQDEYEAFFSHLFEGQESVLPIQYESSGTQQLFALLMNILLALSSGSMVVLDEFDVNLHPDMMNELIALFTDGETNKQNAQILFSTQSHLILSKLDKYQIFLIEKSRDGFSEGWRLDEIGGVRPDDNYAAKYLAGAYGGTPKI